MSARTTLPPAGTEALDSRSTDDQVARATLVDLARANAFFGGRAAVLHGVRQLLAGAPTDRTYTVLDVGAGMGDVLQSVQGRIHTLRPIALDHHRTATKLCHDLGFTTVLADGNALPLAVRAVDIVVASQVLHHFTRAAAVPLIHELNRVARRGVVLADLRRSEVAVLGLRFASSVLRFHPATRHDGVVSIRRGFTRDELAQILDDAGVHATVQRRPGWRLVATWRTTDAHR